MSLGQGVQVCLCGGVCQEPTVASCPQCCEAVYSSVSGLKAHLASCSKVSFQALSQGEVVLGAPSPYRSPHLVNVTLPPRGILFPLLLLLLREPRDCPVPDGQPGPGFSSPVRESVRSLFCPEGLHVCGGVMGTLTWAWGKGPSGKGCSPSLGHLPLPILFTSLPLVGATPGSLKPTC